MRISRTVAYAVRATIELAKNESTAPVPCSQLAAAGEMPERFLLQILRNLVTHGILRSSRGVDGGYTLTRRPADVSLLDLIEAIEGPLDAHPDRLDGLPSEIHGTIQEAMRNITSTARRQLEAIKISQFMPPTYQETKAAG